LLSAIALPFLASYAIAQLPFTVTGVDGTGYAKARVTCTGTPVVGKGKHSNDPTYDLKVDVSCTNVGVPGSASASAQSKSSITPVGPEIQLVTLYNTRANAFEAVGEGNNKLEGESDSYVEVRNTTNAAITLSGKWSITAITNASNPGGYAEAEASLEITDVDGNPLRSLNAGSGSLLICIPANTSFFIAGYAYSKARATSLDPTKGANASGTANASINLSVSNIILGNCTEVIVQDAPPPPP
jgi:hypothetical protein